MSQSLRWPQLDDFRVYLTSSGKLRQTVRTYAYSVGLFWQWCSLRETDAATASNAIVRLYMAEREGKGISGARRHTELAALRLFFTFAVAMGLRCEPAADATLGVKVKRPKTLPTRPMEDEEISRLLAACTSERDRLIILMLASTGMRIEELSLVRGEHIDFRQGTFRIMGKGAKERDLVLRRDLLDRLRIFLGLFTAGPLFYSQQLGPKARRPLSPQQIRKILYRVAERADVKDVHAHRFRSFFAVTYLDQYNDVDALMKILGHESVETTQIYLYWTRERRARKAMEGMTFGFETPPPSVTPIRRRYA